MSYIYAKDKEGFVVKKIEKDLLPDEVIITQSEWEEISGEKYYQETYGRGGARPGSGRKKKNPDNVLQFQVRVSQKEKDFLKYAREHNLDYDSLMEG